MFENIKRYTAQERRGKFSVNEGFPWFLDIVKIHSVKHNYTTRCYLIKIKSCDQLLVFGGHNFNTKHAYYGDFRGDDRKTNKLILVAKRFSKKWFLFLLISMFNGLVRELVFKINNMAHGFLRRYFGTFLWYNECQGAKEKARRLLMFLNKIEFDNI